jgi:hypothetical protein
MHVKRLAAEAAIAVGVGMSVLASGVGLVNAAPLGPPPNCPGCQQDPSGQWGIPAEKCWAYGRVGGGSPRGGGGVPGYLPPCVPHAAAGPPPS